MFHYPKINTGNAPLLNDVISRLCVKARMTLFRWLEKWVVQELSGKQDMNRYDFDNKPHYYKRDCVLLQEIVVQVTR